MPDANYDALIIGSGPAGMTAAVRSSQLGMRVAVLDEQLTPGGQVWRNVERASECGRADHLGPEFAAGLASVHAFRRSGAHYFPRTTVWQLEQGFRAFVLHDKVVRILQAPRVLLATGAMERPAPFPGWTLPGVLTVGAAQILLKSADQIPEAPVWIAGCGPLRLLYCSQLLAAGGHIAGILDTEVPGANRRALAHARQGIRAWRDVLKAAGWTARLRSVPVVHGVESLEALGEASLEAIRYRTADGAARTEPARLLLIHEGVVPDVQFTLALGCRHRWLEAQGCFAPVLDEWGETSVAGCFVAGDAGGIGGAEAAVLAGEIAGYALARSARRQEFDQAAHSVPDLRRRLSHSLALRPLLDTLYAPRSEIVAPADGTVVCRCENVTAGAIRAAIAEGIHEPNHLKAQTRCGMGPCLGRQCATLATRLIADATGETMERIGLPRARPPLRPVTLAQLASLTSATA